MPEGYLARHLSDVEPTPCPCGESRRIFTRDDGPVANIHVTSIRDSKAHYHKHVTEFYYILEGEGVLEVGGDRLELSPGLLVRIDPGTVHRGSGDFKSLIIGVPAWDPEDEWFPEE
jgi:mannose-6-phosphate isomerase-like protein (cupin superfamily)